MLLINLNQNKSNINPYISATLLEKIEEILWKKEKIILYLNKRWTFSSLVCGDCSYFYKCSNCDVAMTVYSWINKLKCNLCGNNCEIPIKCKKCLWVNLQTIWVGTQQIEDSLKKYFSWKINIFRFDLDSVKNKKDKQKALDEIKNADIIIATKMITTWFDLEKIWLIWVILLEQELIIPKYNWEEKAYINIRQLFGRGNRKNQKTEIIVQTFIPDSDLVNNLIKLNYKEFFLNTLQERKIFNYPPFSEIVRLEYRHQNKQKAYDFVLQLKNKLDILNKYNKLEIIFNKQSYKKYNQYYYFILIKWENIRNFLKNIKKEIFLNQKLNVIFD